MPNSKKFTVLVVDDDPSVVKVAREVLQKRFNIIEAYSGNEALETLNKMKGEISCVLLDLNMCDLSGTQVMEVMANTSDLKNIPVVIATSHDSPDEELRCLEKGAIDFVSKPYNTMLLERRIINIVEFKQRAIDLKEVEKDDLTQVYTRPAFYLHAKNLLNEQNEVFDLVVSDIQGFKVINERFGELKADELLKYTASFLKEHLAFGDYIGRYGSDKFIFLARKEDQPINIKIESLLDKFVEGSPIGVVKCKFGIFENVNSSESLSLCASYALTALKRIINDFNIASIVFNEDERKVYDKEKQLTRDMLRAYENDEFKVYYQPKHDTNSHKLVGAEALIRWQHPELGFISPAEFIPLFEATGFVSRADYYVWKRTCENLRKWIDKGIEVVPISVNASKLDFEYDNYLNIIAKPVEDNNLSPKLLNIEVTETINQKNINHLIEQLNACREYGFGIELDDFGSGYSSLNVLGSLPLDVVKIDQSFIKQIDDPRKARILSSSINLGKNLGLVSICEGVETEEQLNILKSFGCDRIQGYFFSKPLSEEDFERYLIQESNKEVIEEYAEVSESSSVYVVDKDFNVVNYNTIVKTNFPKVNKGEKCYKCIHGKGEPCSRCPIVLKQVGPRTVVDMARNRFIVIDCADFPLENGESGHIVTIGSTKMML